jgi:hypothetical protein
MLALGTVQQSNHCAREEFLYELKAGPAGGRLRRPPSAGRPPCAIVHSNLLTRWSAAWNVISRSFEETLEPL